MKYNTASPAFEAVKRINSEGVIVILVEQNVYHALEIASRAYVLESGRITLEGAGKEFLGNDYVKEAYCYNRTSPRLSF